MTIVRNTEEFFKAIQFGVERDVEFTYYIPGEKLIETHIYTDDDDTYEEKIDELNILVDKVIKHSGNFVIHYHSNTFYEIDEDVIVYDGRWV